MNAEDKRLEVNLKKKHDEAERKAATELRTLELKHLQSRAALKRRRQSFTDGLKKHIVKDEAGLETKPELRRAVVTAQQACKEPSQRHWTVFGSGSQTFGAEVEELMKRLDVLQTEMDMLGRQRERVGLIKVLSTGSNKSPVDLNSRALVDKSC